MHFIHNISFNPYVNPITKVLLIPPIKNEEIEALGVC